MTKFTSGELAVMRILWESGELKPSEIQQHFPEPIKNPALRSYLTILLEKGHVTRRKTGKAFVYRAVTKRQTAFRRTLRDFVDAYCDGSRTSLVMNLIRDQRLSEKDLLELKRLADGQHSERKGKRR